MKFSLFIGLIGLAVVSAGPRQLTPEQIERLENWTPDDKQNNWELSGQFEGDMVLVPGQRNGIIDTSYRWPSKTLVYEFDSGVPQASRNLIKNSLDDYTRYTCIKHRERTSSDRNYIYVTNDNSGCWSYVGYLGGRQQLNLQQNGCMYKGTILHEFKHALGFYHQQSATERDDYVTILWQNIESGTESNFDKYPASLITEFGLQYDYGSIMHYGAYSFSKNGQKTIETKHGEEIGQRDGLSNTDIEKVKKMYNC